MWPGLATCAACAIVVVAGLPWRRERRHDRAARLFLSAFAILAAAGLSTEAAGSLTRIQAPDLLLGAGAACALLGVLLLPGAPPDFSGRARTVVDGLVVAASALLVGWQLGLADLYTGAAGPARPLALGLALGYVTVAGMAIVVTTRSPSEARTSLWLASFGLVAVAGGACGLLALRLATDLGQVWMFELAYAGGLILLALSAVWARRAEVEKPAALPNRMSVFVPSLPFAAALVAVTAEAAEADGFEPFVAWCGLAIALLIVARQMLALLENISFWRDLEAKVEARTEQVRRTEAQFRSLVQNSSDLITAVASDGSIRYQSPSASAALGLEPRDVEAGGLASLVHEDDLATVAAALRQARESPQGRCAVECRLRRADGAFQQVEAIVSNLLDDPDVGAVVLNMRDITERKALEQQLTDMAFHDPLTGLANRALFRNRLLHGVARSARSGTALGVLILDLDDFKTVNDTLGQTAGDGLLRSVAARLAEVVRPSDTIARLGGDEFAILVEDLDSGEEPGLVAERALAAFDAPFAGGEHSLSLGVSIGAARGCFGDDGADELLRNADIALHTAKCRGKRRYELFRSDMLGAVMERMELEMDLRGALERGELYLVYQPIVRLDTGSIRAVEALVRWNHPARGLIPPGEFIPVAERSGVIEELGAWVLSTACRQLRRWREHEAIAESLLVSVNLSARQLERPSLPEEVLAVLNESGLPPSALVLEVTESVLVEDPDVAVKRLAQLRDAGIRLAIDDFGTGYSSLSYLRRFPADTLKIDRAFVRDLADGSDDTALARAIITLAHELDIEPVAEGVETVEQLAELRSMGCNLGQGYLFARPLESREIHDLLQFGAVSLPVAETEPASAGALAPSPP